MPVPIDFELRESRPRLTVFQRTRLDSRHRELKPFGHASRQQCDLVVARRRVADSLSLILVLDPDVQLSVQLSLIRISSRVGQ